MFALGSRVGVQYNLYPVYIFYVSGQDGTPCTYSRVYPLKDQFSLYIIQHRLENSSKFIFKRRTGETGDNDYKHQHLHLVSCKIFVIFKRKGVSKSSINTAKRDIIYLDATGGIVKKIKAYKKIFMYALIMRHPFGKTVELPALSYLTSSHSMDSVRFSLMALKENERENGWVLNPNQS